MSAPYAPPLDQLLTLGETDRTKGWLNYAEMGVRPEHVPELLRMARDEALLQTTHPVEAWAPMHALRALGQLRDPSVVDALLGHLTSFTDETWDDYYAEDLPEVLALIGEPALPAALAFFHDRTKDSWARGWIAEALAKIGIAHPETRARAVAALTHQVEEGAQNTDELNALIVSALVMLKAVESAGVIEQAFARGEVDEGFDGDWNYIKYDLGLGPRPAYERRFHPGSALLPALNPRQRAEARRKKAKTDRKRKRRK